MLPVIRSQAIRNPNAGWMKRRGHSYDAPDVGKAEPMNAYVTAITNIGIAASATAINMPGPASAVAGAITAKIATPTAVPNPRAMTPGRSIPVLRSAVMRDVVLLI